MKRTALVAWLLFSCLASSNAGNMAFPQTDDKSPLRLKLSITNPEVCFGASPEVQAELVNESKVKVAIDIQTIWYEISFTFFRSGQTLRNRDGSGSSRNTGGSHTEVGDPGPNYDGEYLVLNPGESYKAARLLKLHNGFFSSRGNYKLKVTYGQFRDKSFERLSVWKGTVESNDLTLKLISCKSAKKKYST